MGSELVGTSSLKLGDYFHRGMYFYNFNGEHCLSHDWRQENMSPREFMCLASKCDVINFSLQFISNGMFGNMGKLKTPTLPSFNIAKLWYSVIASWPRSSVDFRGIFGIRVIRELLTCLTFSFYMPLLILHRNTWDRQTDFLSSKNNIQK